MRLFVVSEEEKAHLRLRRQAVSVKLLSVARDKRPEARNRRRCCEETRTLLGARNMVEINSRVSQCGPFGFGGVVRSLGAWCGALSGFWIFGWTSDFDFSDMDS